MNEYHFHKCPKCNEMDDCECGRPENSWSLCEGCAEEEAEKWELQS